MRGFNQIITIVKYINFHSNILNNNKYVYVLNMSTALQGDKNHGDRNVNLAEMELNKEIVLKENIKKANSIYRKIINEYQRDTDLINRTNVKLHTYFTDMFPNFSRRFPIVFKFMMMRKYHPKAFKLFLKLSQSCKTLISKEKQIGFQASYVKRLMMLIHKNCGIKEATAISETIKKELLKEMTNIEGAQKEYFRAAKQKQEDIYKSRRDKFFQFIKNERDLPTTDDKTK